MDLDKLAAVIKVELDNRGPDGKAAFTDLQKNSIQKAILQALEEYDHELRKIPNS